MLEKRRTPCGTCAGFRTATDSGDGGGPQRDGGADPALVLLFSEFSGI